MAQGLGQLDLDVHYRLAPPWSASLSLYNLLNTHCAAAVLQSKIADYPDGQTTSTSIRSSPSSAHFTISWRIGAR